MENLEKTALIKLYMGFKLSKLCSGVGNLFRFLDTGPEFCTEKLCLGRDFDRKNSGLGGWQLVKLIPDVYLTAE